MFYRIFLFVALFVPSRVLAHNAGMIAFSARDAALLEPPLFVVEGDHELPIAEFDEDRLVAVEKTAKLVAGISAEESGGVGSPGDDGNSCGGMQLKEVWREGHPCSELNKDLVLSMRLAIRALHHLVNTCGSLQAAVGAYATGKCGGAPALSRRRLRFADGLR